jgi:hypothetical protein
MPVNGGIVRQMAALASLTERIRQILTSGFRTLHSNTFKAQEIRVY